VAHLTDEQVRLLVAGCLGVRPESLPADVVDRLVQDGEGNPFYVEELLAGMVSQGSLVRSAGSWRPTGHTQRAECPRRYRPASRRELSVSARTG